MLRAPSHGGLGYSTGMQFQNHASLLALESSTYSYTSITTRKSEDCMMELLSLAEIMEHRLSILMSWHYSLTPPKLSNDDLQAIYKL